jgi:hypothetical protein
VAHFKCVTCQSRVWRDGAPADHPGELCPGCAGPLEPVRDLNELVGLRALRPRPRTRPPGFPDAPQIFAQIRAAIAQADGQRRPTIGPEHRGTQDQA